MSKVSIVIPAHNEEENIPVLIEALILTLESFPETRDFEIVIVNDNSRDGTGKLIDVLAARDPRVRSLHSTMTPGFGNTVKIGMKNATGEIIIPVMADLSDDPQDIPRMVKKINEGYDIAYGSRFCRGGHTTDYPWKKMIANRAFNYSIRLLFGIHHKDVTNAFKAYRREVLDAIGIDNLEANGFDLTVEIPLKAHILGFKSVEVPVSWTERKKGEAKLKLSQNCTRYGKRLLKMFIIGNMLSIKDILSITIKGSWLYPIIALIVGIILLAGTFSFTGFSNIFEILSRINPVYVIVACMAIFMSFILRTWRWSVLLRSSGHRIQSESGFKCIMFGWFINYILPLRIGDLARAVTLKSTESIPLSVSLFTIVIERAMDMLMLALLLSAAVLLISSGNIILLEVAAVSLLVSIGLLVATGLLYKFDKHLSSQLGNRFGNISEALTIFKGGAREFWKNPEAVTLCLLISLPVWICDLLCLYVSAIAIGHDLSYGLITIAGITAFISQALPITPAGIGVQEGTITGVLLLFGISAPIGISMALVDHFARVVVIFTFGTISMIHISLNSREYFSKIRKKQAGEAVNE
jgi:uncharacterized protein (TIRG00374 family)